MSGRKLSVVVVIAALAAGCGDDDPEPTTTAAAKPPPAARVDIESFLLQPGEEPGFDEIESPQTESEAAAAGLPPEGVEQLRRNGFEQTAYAPMSAENGNGGVAVVTLFKTEAGALAQLEYETSTQGIRSQLADAAKREGVEDESRGAKIRRFTVKGIPSARGWSGLDIHANRIGNLFWVQGRCMLTIANEGEGSFAEPLSAGARAIHRRTRGRCP